MKFFIYGHKNILSTHKNTLEFTKDDYVTKNGDCIIGINSNFKIDKEFLKKNQAKLTINCDEEDDELIFDINPDFNDKHEIVIRKSNFNSKRTLGINATKASIDINRKLINKLKHENIKATIIIEVI